MLNKSPLLELSARKLLMISHKETWSDITSPSGYATVGGFPFQVNALSRLFDQTQLIVTLRKTMQPAGTIPLTGDNLLVHALPEPYGSGLGRKLALILWLPRHIRTIWNAVRQADVVHTPTPGDVGTIGLVIALIQRKHLFVRHCGTWGAPVTVADKVLLWLLERVAGDRNVVLATGESDRPPSAKNPNIHWIFSTTLNSAELDHLPRAQSWMYGQPLRLITVCRLSKSKNVQAVIHALPQIIQEYPFTRLDVLGDGEYRPTLEALVSDLKLEEHVVFHGNVSHQRVLECLPMAHIFIFPTQVNEGFPKAVLEAVACGLPVVASSVSAIPSIIRDCGQILDAPTAESISSVILKLLGNPARLAEMSTKARQKAKNYTLEAWQSQVGHHLSSAWNVKAS